MNNAKIARIDNAKQPWLSFPVISWWDMEQFSAEVFYEIGRYLGMIKELFSEGLDEDKLRDINRDKALESQLEWILESCEKLDLKVSVNCAGEFLEKIEDGDFSVRSALELFHELGNTIRREMETVLFFHLPASQASFYNKPELFGRAVSAKFPNLQEDMVEAGNCLALGRGTACVFHLMRMMEAGVREFAYLLGVPDIDTKYWHIILEKINKELRALPDKAPRTLALSEAAANLYSVKLAWRNEVMHPKATYTPEEAEDVLRQVKIFIGNLAKIVPNAPLSATVM